MRYTHKLLSACLVCSLATVGLAAEQTNDTTSPGIATAPVAQQVPQAVTFSATEHRQLHARADAADKDLARQRAGAFYEEPLFWGGVAAGVILLILL